MIQNYLPYFELDSISTQQDFQNALVRPKKWISRNIKLTAPQLYAFRVGERHNLGHMPNNVICYACPEKPVLEGDFVLVFLRSGIIELRRDFFARRIKGVRESKEVKKILKHQEQHTIHKIVAIVAEGAGFGEVKECFSLGRSFHESKPNRKNFSDVPLGLSLK